ncbi:hypothetical protein KKC00_00955 [Patescibacteria group bacterium]|nr:hypothetical protein [Patescibacteria group bacterium]
MLWFYIAIFIISCLGFYFAGKMVVDGLITVTKYLRLKEFVVAFFVMAAAASLPNLLIGLSSAVRGIPQLSFGDITGNNLAALTIAVAIVALFAKGGIPAESQTVRTTSFFVMASALLPLVLIADGKLSRIDGILLILLFAYYIFWLFSKKERFNKPYKDNKHAISITQSFKFFLKDLIKIFIALIIFIIAAQGMVSSAQFFAKNFNISLILIGILITGLGSTIPEIYFDVISVKRGQTWMILGDLMGAVIIPSTLVLGIVVLICPIYIYDFSSLALARFFIIVAALFFPIIVRSGRQISKKEALILLSIYVIFLVSEILLKDPFF